MHTILPLGLVHFLTVYSMTTVRILWKWSFRYMFTAQGGFMSPQLHSLRRRILLVCIVLIVLVFPLVGLVRQVALVNAAPSQSDGRNDELGTSTSTHVSGSLSQAPADQPALTVTPGNLDNHSSTCRRASTWVCKVIVDGSSPHSINWQASGSATFIPQGGTVPPGVTVTISNLPCPVSETFVFTGTETKGGRLISVPVTWTCTLPPSSTPSPSPSPTKTGMTPTPSPTPGTPTTTPTPTSSSTSLSTPQPGTTPTLTTGSTPASSTTIPPGSQNPPDPQALSSSLFTIAAFVLALAAFLLYLIPQQQSSSSLLFKALTLILPKSVLRRLGDR